MEETKLEMLKWWSDQPLNKKITSGMAIIILSMSATIITMAAAYVSMQKDFRITTVNCEKAASEARQVQRNIDDSIRKVDLKAQHIEDVNNCEESKRAMYLPRKEVIERRIEKIKNSQSVGLHIRRSDYIINESVLNYHGVCPPSYYFSGLEKIKEKTKNLELFVFSDDIAWCKQNLIFDLPCTYIDHNTGEKSFEDMRLMSLCKHNIIANSSFSWWGAWLNANPSKIVVAPTKWFNDLANQSQDIYPPNWIKI